MIAYKYNAQVDPPAPFVLTTLHNADGTKVLRNQPAQLDCAADVSAVPARIVDELGLVEVGNVLVRGFGMEAQYRPTYLLHLQVHDFAPFAVEVLSDPADPHYLLLGREVLNRYRLLLDGPNQRLEIG